MSTQRESLSPRAEPTVGSGGPTPRLCPYLATPARSWRAAVPTAEHVCTAVVPAVRLSTDKQRRLCVTTSHTSCATYLAAAERDGARLRGGAGLRDRFPSPTPVLLERPRLSVPELGVERLRGAGQLGLVVLLVVAVAAIAVARLGPPAGPGPSTVPGAAISSASPGAGRIPTAVPVSPSVEATAIPATPTESGSPSTPPASATPAPSPSRSPGPSGSAATTYVVRSGDTLSSIAARFGTTVAAIQQLNGIADPSLIHPGEVLRIP